MAAVVRGRTEISTHDRTRRVRHAAGLFAMFGVENPQPPGGKPPRASTRKAGGFERGRSSSGAGRAGTRDGDDARRAGWARAVAALAARGGRGRLTRGVAGSELTTG